MQRTKKSYSPRTSPPSLPLAFLVGVVLLALPVHADWLIIRDENKMIETQGPWSVAADTLTYIDKEGQEKQLPLAQIDLVASEKLTAMQAAKPVVLPKTATSKPSTSTARTETTSADTSQAESGESQAESGEPKVILYMTDWCGYCRRTSSFLKSMKVAFVEKNIEKDPEAAKEYQQKAKGYRGIPVLDINGQIVKGFRVTQIRDLIEDMKRREAAAASSEAAGR